MFWIKTLVSALIIAGASELAKRYSLIGALLASLPLVSVLALVWLYMETKSIEKTIHFSYGVFWAVMPSLLFFVTLPLLLKYQINFYLAVGISCLVMFGAYTIYLFILSKYGVSL